MTEEDNPTINEPSEDNHPAILTLRQLFENNQINSAVFNALSSKFKKLHQAFSQSCSTEQILLRRTRELNKELKAQKLTIQNSAAQQQEHKSAFSALRQYVTNIQTELEGTREQIEVTKANTSLKHKERDKLADKVAKARDDRRLKLEPLKRQVQVEITNLENEIGTLERNIDTLRKQGQDLMSIIASCEEQLADLDKKKRAATQKMLEISPLPDKTRQKASAVQSSHNTMLSEEKTSNNQLITAENTLQELHGRAHDLETEHQHLLNDIDGMTIATGDMKVKSEDLRQKCQDSTNIKQQREYESRKVLKQVSEMNKEIFGLETRIDTVSKDIAKKDKEAVRLEEAMASQTVEKRDLENQVALLSSDEQREIDSNSKMSQQLQHAMEEKEAAFQAYVKMEGVTAEVLAEIKTALQDKNRKQAIHDQLSKKEHEIERQLAEASIIRDRKAREMASMIKRTKDAKDAAKESKLDIDELERKRGIIIQRLKEYSDMYEKVKADRNRYVTIIQTSRQLKVEFDEKIRILFNEVEVLRKEFEAVDAEVSIKKNELVQSRKRRDTTKSELKKAELKYFSLQQKIDFQSTETKRLNKVLRSLEDIILENQKRFSTQSNDCSMIQQHLIDKKDALCVIYEQFRMHEEVMKEGERQLSDQEQKIRILNLSINDLQRRIDITRRKIPQVKAYDEEIKDIQQQLDREKKDVDEITKKLEIPDEQARPRAYCGKDFTLKELEQKVATYEQRINAKGQQLWEKEILLKEIEEKIAELGKDAQNDISKTEKVLKKGGNLRAEAMSLRRKKMAAYSEMALYAGQKVELEEEKQSIKETLDAAGQRTNRGEAFDEYADKIIRMHVRDQNTPKNVDSDDEEEKRPGRQRFDAYPTADGLSKPYGAFPAFQAAKPAGHLRHFKNETLRPIEL